LAVSLDFFFFFSFFCQTLAPNFSLSVIFFTFIVFCPFFAGQVLGQSPFFTIFTTVSPVVDTVIAPFLTLDTPSTPLETILLLESHKRLARSEQ
jgi:hypothetical protein